MKVLLFNYHYDIETISIGAAQQNRDIAAALERRGHTVDLQFRNARPADADTASVKNSLKQVGVLKKFGHAPKILLRNVALARREKQIIAESRPDVLLAVNFFCISSPLKAARAMGLPFVLFVDAPVVYEYVHYKTHYHAYPILSSRVESRLVHGADQVTCISNTLKGYLMRYGAPAEKITVIPNGVDEKLIRPAARDAEMEERLDLAGKKVIGFVGSFNFFTDIQRFISSVQELRARHRDAVFLFVGGGNESRQKLEEAARSAGAGDGLRFTGLVPHTEIPRYLSLMDIAIGPYRGDYLFYQSSLKLLEYMAAGIPPVFPALGQITETIQHGHNGLLYRWDDHDGFFDNLDRLLENEELRHAMARAARETIQQGWTWDVRAGQLEYVLEKAVRKK